MHALVSTFRFLPLLLLGHFTEAGAQEFAPIVTQIDAVGDLNARLARHAIATEQLQRDHKSTLLRLQKSRQDLQQINLAALRQTFIQWEADLNRQIADRNLLLDIIDGNTPLSPNVDSFLVDSFSRGIATTLAQQANVYAINVEQHSKQLNAAGQLTAERHQKIVRHLADLAQQAVTLQIDAREIRSKYLELADVANVLSKYERKATKRVLASVDKRFTAAQLALALTHIRLHDLAAAEQVLSRLNTGNDRYSEAVSLSLQAEIAAVRDDQRAVRLLLNKQKQLHNGLLSSDPLIVLLNARTDSLLQHFDDAQQRWNAAIKNNRYPVAAHRGMANLHIQQFHANPDRTSHAREALTHAKLASSLSVESDWSSQLVLAVATAINGDFGTAAEIAAQAADNAVLERKTQCLDAAEQLRRQKIPAITNVL